MATTINHTKRKKLKREQFDISLLADQDGIPYFDLNLDIKDQDIGSGAKVFVEANTGNTMQRFDFGTVGYLVKPPSTSLHLLSATATPDFRVLVVDSNRSENDETLLAGRISAIAGKARVNSGDSNDGGVSLLIVNCTFLDEMVWNVKMNIGHRPELCLNHKIPDIKHKLTTMPEYQAMILPAALRQVISSYKSIGNKDDDDVVQAQWWQLAEELAGPVDEDADADEFNIWLDDVVSEFCRQHAFCSRLLESAASE